MRELEYTVLYTIYEGIGIYCMYTIYEGNWNILYCILYMRELEFYCIVYYICGNWNILYCILYMRELEYTVLYTIYAGIGIYCFVYYI